MNRLELLQFRPPQKPPPASKTVIRGPVIRGQLFHGGGGGEGGPISEGKGGLFQVGAVSADRTSKRKDQVGAGQGSMQIRLSG